MFNIDWIDVFLHVAAAFIVVFIFPSFWVAVANAVFWIVREIYQDIRKGNRIPWPIRRSLQKDLEGFLPAIVGFIVYFIS